jgi:hypothetical protein
MAAHALTLTQQILQLAHRGADNASLAQRLDEALSFAPGYDLGGGLSSERWSMLYALAHGERDGAWRARLVAALWAVYDEVSGALNVSNEDDDYDVCPACSSEGRSLGFLGRILWLRCRACGWEYSMAREPVDLVGEPMGDADGLAVKHGPRRHRRQYAHVPHPEGRLMPHAAFAYLADQTPEQTRAWLEAVLEGTILLPRATHDATPATVLLRNEPTLPPIARRNLQAAVEALFSKVLTDGSAARSTEWVQSLCELVVRLKLEPLAWRVPEFVDDAVSFEGRSFDHRVALLNVITDLRCPVRPGFWQDLSARDPGRYAILAVSALLISHPEQALHLLPQLPDDERVGEALEVLWSICADEIAQGREAGARGDEQGLERVAVVAVFGTQAHAHVHVVLAVAVGGGDLAHHGRAQR